jgi:hypothetical protein
VDHHSLAVGLKVGSKHANAARTTLKETLDEARNRTANKVIFSSEMFIEGETDFRLLRVALDGTEVAIVAYLRRPDRIEAAAYNQAVRGRRKRRQQPIAEDPPSYDPTFRKLLVPWIEANLGELTLAPFDLEQWSQGNLFHDFFEMLGIDASGLDLQSHAAEMNRSLPTGLIEALRVMNRIPLRETTHEALVSDLYDLWNKRPELYAEVELLTSDQQRELIAQLKEHLPLYRPHYRAGFDEGFLLSPSPLSRAVG